jgi:polyisoprenoid-binding protein YceI
MKNFKKQVSAILTVIAIIFLGTIPQNLLAQTTYKLSPGQNVNIKVLGSSNVHDWTMVSSLMESQGEFKFDGDRQLVALHSFSFSMDAKSLKSEHTSMDDRTYKTMKADQYPKIIFKLNSAVITAVQKNKYLIKATGDLVIAGVTQNITLNVTAVVNADNTISCTGSQKIQLTDYKIEPPSFMLGAMKVKNDLTIQFNLTYKNNQLLSKTEL